MTKRIFLFLFLLMSMSGKLVFAASPQIYAEAAVVMRADNRQVVFAKDPDKIMYPASTTKIMTLITALEKGDPGQMVVVSPQVAQCDGSSLELKANDRLTLREAEYGMMLVSGNDAAEAIAETVAGSIPAFVELMNDKAEKIGATRTHFSNPHGLPDPFNHFTTARDLALITAYGLQNPDFARIVATRDYAVRLQNRSALAVHNTNKLLATYSGANGVKTGFTDAAGECLVAAAKRGNIQLVAVILNSDYRWSDAAKLLDYGFQQSGGLSGN
jgi:D-alanyl-D-alanine carboxypeptidase (penicillin-binding protein 5/6)